MKLRYELDKDKQIKVYKGDVYLGKYKNFDEIFVLIMAISWSTALSVILKGYKSRERKGKQGIIGS